ncbi:retrotransposable element Tf2, partial [Tanacetum coccineum]
VANDEEGVVWNPVNEDGDCELYDVINVVQEENSVPHISLNALHGRNAFHTMRVSGYVGKHEIRILIDSGSTHNFLDCNSAKKLGCPLTSTYPLQGEIFVEDMMILPLGGYEMVLGIQWLSTLGNIICNFKDLKMSLQYNGRTINLRGSQKEVVQWMQGKQLAKNIGIEAQLSSMILCVYPESVLSMVSAKPNTHNVPENLQTLLGEYNDVFEVPKELPPVRSHDHRIPLKEGTPTINIRPYGTLLLKKMLFRVFSIGGSLGFGGRPALRCGTISGRVLSWRK